MIFKNRSFFSTILPIATLFAAVSSTHIFAAGTSPQINIVPTSTAPISLSPGTPSTVTYNVTVNALEKNIAVFAASPGYPIPSYVATSITSDGCSGTTRQPGDAACQFTVSMQAEAGHTGAAFTLAPRVSGNGGASSAIPTAANRIGVTIGSGGGGGSITITPNTVSVNIPGTVNASSSFTQLTATETIGGVSTDVTNTVNWSSSNTDYATVTTSGSTRGRVTGVSVPSGTTTTSVTITATDPSTSAAGAKLVTVNLAVGSSYNQGYVYCLGTGSGNCAFLPSGNCPSGQPCVGEVIAQTDNVSSSIGQQWYNGSYTTTSATSLTDGKANTQKIVTSQSSGAYAANTCYTYNSGDSNNTWYLPAKNELNVIYENLTTLNNAGAQLNTDGSAGPTYSIYWSSSEFDVNVAWAQGFSDGNQINFFKNGTYGVRCVRAF